jgi:hypothetical protein
MAYLRVPETIGLDFRGIGDDAAWGHFGQCLAPPAVPATTAQSPAQIQFIEVSNVRIGRSGGRLTTSFTVAGAMDQAKRARFISRFMNPLQRYELSRNLCRALNFGSHPVRIAWGNGQFGFNGTIALNRGQAVGGSGSASVIFIDEDAPDWRKFETIRSHPDVGLFHELVHAFYIQRGATLNDEREMERLVIGIGRHSTCRLTENAYRDVRSLPRRCCWDREQL